tara:strand:+ start:733 stop:1209 length:477 start_codon:yes stop_codon:yes gene_type:complete
MDMSIEEKIKKMRDRRTMKTEEEWEEIRDARARRRKEARDQEKRELAEKTRIKSVREEKEKKKKEELLLKKRDEVATIEKLKQWILKEGKNKDELRVLLISHPELYQNVDNDFISIKVKEYYKHLEDLKEGKKKEIVKVLNKKGIQKMSTLGGFGWRR